MKGSQHVFDIRATVRFAETYNALNCPLKIGLYCCMRHPWQAAALGFWPKWIGLQTYLRSVNVCVDEAWHKVLPTLQL